MSESTIVKTKRDGTIKFSDNAGANTYIPLRPWESRFASVPALLG
mgnify:CR=1 FL=1